MLGVFGGPAKALAQLAPPAPAQAHSRSGQFIVTAVRGAQNPGPYSNLETNRGFFRLEPTLVSISTERTKNILRSYLGAPPDWTGKIFISLYPAAATDDPPRLVCEQFRDSWQYRLALPNVIDRTRYIDAVVQVLLLEMANRKAKSRSAEIPSWLTEGLSAHLLASSATQIILPPPNTPANGIVFSSTESVGLMQRPLERAHQVLSSSAALTFQQLSWPPDAPLAGSAREVFRSSAQLFVSELMNLKEGPACLRAMLAELPDHYNWQFAFLHAFNAYFQRPLDVEKWWSLQIVHFTGRGLAQDWPKEESWQKLDEILHSPIEVRTSTNELPLRSQASLQTMIREWDGPRLADALVEKQRELDQLRLRISPTLLGLVDAYRQALAVYLQLAPAQKPLNDRSRAPTLQTLDHLDALRAEMRPGQKSGVVARQPAAAKSTP
jgi:hypothetical protein